MSDEQLAALHERASTAFVVSTEDDDVAEAILLLCLRDRVDEIVTVLTVEESEHTFTVTTCCDDQYGRTVRGIAYPTEDCESTVWVDIPLSVIVGVHVW